MGATKEQCLAAAAMLLDAGLLKDNKAETLARTNKILHAFLHGDYIPKNVMSCGGLKDMINLRAAPPGMRCARQTGDDWPQSGPIYCGRPVVAIADSKERPGAYYAMCKRCLDAHRLKLPEQTEKVT